MSPSEILLFTIETLLIIFLLLIVVMLVILLIKKTKIVKKQNKNAYSSIPACNNQETNVPKETLSDAISFKRSIDNEEINNELELSREQRLAFNQIEYSNENYFITGKAGTGKSVLLQYFVKNTNKQVAVIAPTGVAALIVGGQTIHSFLNLGNELQDTEDKEQISRLPNYKIDVLRHLDTLIIDEVSMVSADVMDMIDAKLKYARKNDKPFGGCQIVVFGDLYQLPPVVNSGQVYRFLDDKYKSRFFFGAPEIRNNPFNIIALQEVFRQKDNSFINILNRIRVGNVDELLLEDINSRCVLPPKNDSIITLTCDNVTAARINKNNLDNLPTKEYVYEGIIEGDAKQFSFPTDIQLHLKVGALVMMLKNDCTDNTSSDKTQKARWVNGTFGIVSYLSNEEVRVTINGVEHTIRKESWQKYQYRYDAEKKRIDKEVVSTFIQFPIRVAYAITIHKSQGQTYDKVIIDLGKGAFEDGQVYVALSRCRSFSNLYLTRKMTIGDCKTNPEILAFFRENNLIDPIEKTELYQLYFVNQGSDEWHKLRNGMIGGTSAYKLRTRSLDETLSTLSNSSPDDYCSYAMQRGKDLESVGISLFEKQTNIKVSRRVGYIQSNIYSNAGYSPDGVVFDNCGRITTIVEHKAFFEDRHLKNMQQIDNEVYYQIQFGMFVSGASDAYLILYNPDISNEDLQLHIKHIEVDDYVFRVFKCRFEKKDYEIDFINAEIKNNKEQMECEKRLLENQKASKKQKRLIKQYSLDGVLLNTYDSISKAAENGSVSPTSISKCLSGIRKTSGGYIWKRDNTD